MRKRLIVPGNTERVSLRFCVCCFQDGGLQQIALFGKERAVIDKQKPHNKTGKVRSAGMSHRQGESGNI